MNTLSAASGLELVIPASGDSLATRRSLLGRLQDLGDLESWRTFFASYSQLIYNFARKNGLSDDQAQDVLQETVIAVARQMPQFRYDPAKGSFKHWLLLICRRRIHDQFRQLYRCRELGSEALQAEALPAATPPPDAAIEEDWDQEWRQNVFQLALAQVRRQANPKHYQVFDYCVLQAMRPREVASMLGLSTAQVYLAKHRVSAAVKRAAKALEAAMAERK